MMNVLITNDDGPLNDQFSPYIRPFIQNLLKYRPNWNITIVIPHIQRSWNSKAHLAGKDLSISYLYTDPLQDNNQKFYGPFTRSIKNNLSSNNIPENAIEWCLIDGTPASCVNIALHHLKPRNGSKQFDLVISGPNVGRNTSAAYITSSATVGAAMEATITSSSSSFSSSKSIALSWAYFHGQKFINNEHGLLDMASRCSLDVISHLIENWDSKHADLYSINIPLIPSLSIDTKVLMAPIWENRWGSMFDHSNTTSSSISESTSSQQQDIEDGSEVNDQSIKFHWNPKFNSHWDSIHVKNEQVKHDMDVIESGHISVTPLRAVFQLSSNFKQQELTIDHDNKPSSSSIAIVLSIDSKEYIYKPLHDALTTHLKPMIIVSNLMDPAISNGVDKIFHYGDYEQLDMDKLSSNSTHYFTNSYIYRKALIRKHYLSHTIHNYIVKNPKSILNKATMETFTIDLDYAEFLDDSLDENWELRQELEQSQINGKWWIVKPSMSDKGQGIRVFQTIDDLQAIFDSFDDEVDDEAPLQNGSLIDDNKIIISQLRHFIIQEYLTNPLLLPSMSNRKFHIRCYITCMGDLKVFVYDRMLALFAPMPFIPLTNCSSQDDTFNPTDLSILQSHLTNTCLQTNNENKGLSVIEFDQLTDIKDEDKQKIKQQIYDITHDIFIAAKQVNSLNFQPLPNALETFGVDFLVDDKFQVKLLEINAYPDFKQTGDDLKGLIEELFVNVTKYCIKPLLQGEGEESQETDSSSFKNVLNYKSNNCDSFICSGTNQPTFHHT